MTAPRRPAMSGYRESLNAYYGAVDISARILDRLAQAGKDPDALTRDDLVFFDEFHGGGRRTTRSLAEFAGIRAGLEVLDAGSGIGGPARTLAAEFGCRVVGLDITEEFVRAANMLTERLGMADRVTFRAGDMTDMPLEDRAFDVVWSQNTLMNVADKDRALAEVHRVLRPGGIFAFETVVAGPEPGTRFPVFWAESPDLDHLVTPEDLRARLAGTGLVETAWEDITGEVIALSRRRMAAYERGDRDELGLGVIVPDRAEEKMRNSLRNNEEGRTAAVQAVFTHPD